MILASAVKTKTGAEHRCNDKWLAGAHAKRNEEENDDDCSIHILSLFHVLKQSYYVV